MKQKKNISLIVVVFNRTALLRYCLIAINQQTILPGEVIITDDGSHEDIPAGIADLLPELNFKIKYVWQPNKGFRAAKCRNNGIRVAGGDYLVFLDQDILITKGYLKKYDRFGMEGQYLTALPVLLNERQTASIDEKMVRKNSFTNLVDKKQLRRIHKQYFKDSFYHFQRKFFSNDHRPKVRSGVFGLFKNDILKVDGFDENYQGWGNEDDDLGRRLNKAGIVGRTVFYDEFPVHMYHAPFRVGKQNVNHDYYMMRLSQIKAGQVKAVQGLTNPIGDEKLKIQVLK